MNFYGKINQRNIYIFLTLGTLRSDRIHPAGNFTLHDLLAILPIVDPVLVVRATGAQLLEALENGVYKYPALDGRYVHLYKWNLIISDLFSGFFQLACFQD